MYNDVITLVKEVNAVNAMGDVVKTCTERTIMADVKSIGGREFYEAHGVGLRPEIVFVIADFLDYQNEQKIKYKPFGGTLEDYFVIRTYRTGNGLEITCRRGVDVASA